MARDLGIEGEREGQGQGRGYMGQGQQGEKEEGIGTPGTSNILCTAHTITIEAILYHSHRPDSTLPTFD
jgi:hypothetical protein